MAYVLLLYAVMSSPKKRLRLVDMDIGLFVSYQLTTESLTTKMFRCITLNSIPLNKIMVFREAEEADVTKLNRINWFSFLPWRRTRCPVYTLQRAENSPRIFMKLDHGSHIAIRNALDHRHEG